MIIFFKSCPKCGGDVFSETDRFGRYRQCFQCGWVRDVAEPVRAAVPEPCKHDHRGAGVPNSDASLAAS
ncbi:MAG: hypothetical protein HY261_07545 [Chloroflexi bacterium]|nr:hypothetical protein [Chloroflexota bacterium]